MLRVHNPTPPPRPSVPPPVQVPVFPEYSHFTVWPTLAQLNAKIAAINDKELPIHIRPGPSKNLIRGLVAFMHAVAVPTPETPEHISIFIGFG